MVVAVHQPTVLRRVLMVTMLLSLVRPEFAQAHNGRTLKGFENPESAFWDRKTGSFYVSNFGAGSNPLDREVDGYLSKVSGDGQMVEAKWVKGLRSPKGIHRRGDDLLVADVGQLIIIDIAGARIRQAIDLEQAFGAVFLNDVTVDTRTGDAYVSETGQNAIYRLPALGKPELWRASSEKFEGPKGLFLDDYRLLVANYGKDPDGSGPAPPEPGRVVAVNMLTGNVEPLGGMAPLGNLDGIDRLDTDWMVTDAAGHVWQVTEEGKATKADQISNAAGLGVRPGDRMAAVPTRTDHTVVFLPVPRRDQGAPKNP